MFGLMSRKASITTLPFTDWMGSTTTARALRESWCKYRVRFINNSHCTNLIILVPVREGLEALLRVDVDPGEPAAEAGVGVVPADHHLRPAGLLQHVQHLRLPSTHGENQDLLVLGRPGRRGPRPRH